MVAVTLPIAWVDPNRSNERLMLRLRMQPTNCSWVLIPRGLLGFGCPPMKSGLLVSVDDTPATPIPGSTKMLSTDNVTTFLALMAVMIKNDKNLLVTPWQIISYLECSAICHRKVNAREVECKSQQLVHVRCQRWRWAHHRPSAKARNLAGRVRTLKCLMYYGVWSPC